MEDGSEAHLGLQQGKPHADASSGALTKRQEGHRISLGSVFLAKVLGVELVRVGIVLFVIVDAANVDVNHIPSLENNVASGKSAKMRKCF